MKSIEEALQIIKESIIFLTTEKINFIHSLNRVLAEDIIASISMPPFNKSAMDGYACRKEDLNNILEIVEEIPAGKIPLKIINKNTCSKIMTGAIVPEGADIVIMKEHIELVNNNFIRICKQSSSANICYIGEDIQKGTIVLKKGDLIKPSHIAILASMGITSTIVFKQPSIAILSTGNEIIEPNQEPLSAQIRNSNGYQLFSQIQQIGITPNYLGISRDDETEIRTIVLNAIYKYDILIISGGVSVGDFDFIPKVLLELKADILFHGLKVKPGKHILFAKYKNKFIFGLPGNPVSSYVQFEILIKSFILKLMGYTQEPLSFYLPLESDYFRKKTDSMQLIPITFTKQGSVIPIEYNGSAHIHAFTKAKGVMEIPEGRNEIKKGEIVHVRSI